MAATTAASGGAKDNSMNPCWSGGRLSGAGLALAALAWLLAAVPAAEAEEASLGIELNKLENSDQGCRSIFVFDNRTGHELSRFRIDLILFDTAGVYSKQLLLDMAPLYEDKKTVTSFVLDEAACDQLGSVLVNDVPWCEDGAGAAIDCVRMLKVSSRAEVPLQK
jgi:hypothetical protein